MVTHPCSNHRWAWPRYGHETRNADMVRLEACRMLWAVSDFQSISSPFPLKGDFLPNTFQHVGTFRSQVLSALIECQTAMMVRINRVLPSLLSTSPPRLDDTRDVLAGLRCPRKWCSLLSRGHFKRALLALVFGSM